MDQETSPFRPGRLTPPELFTGRVREIQHLRGMARAVAQGGFRIGFVCGERGIGKSSLASFARHLSGLENGTAGCQVFLGGVRDLNEMLRRTFDRLLEESIDKPWHGRIREFFGDRVRRVGLFGVSIELDLESRDLAILARDFVPVVARLLEKIKDQKSGLLLVLDDINGLAGSSEFANWVKSTVDEIATSEREVPLCILVVGLEDRRQELVSKQPSLARVFALIDVDPWTDEEVREFYRKSFSATNATVADEGIDLLTRYTGGLPVLAHEIGDAVWRAAPKPEISQNDIAKGILNAAEIIGRKFLDPQVFRAIRSQSYRSILRKIADQPRGTFRRSEIMQHLTDREERVVDNFLRRMIKLGALQRDPEIRGGYRFPNRLYELYFFMESRRVREV